MQHELWVGVHQLNHGQQQVLMAPSVQISGLLFELQAGHLLLECLALLDVEEWTTK